MLVKSEEALWKEREKQSVPARRAAAAATHLGSEAAAHEDGDGDSCWRAVADLRTHGGGEPGKLQRLAGAGGGGDGAGLRLGLHPGPSDRPTGWG